MIIDRLFQVLVLASMVLAAIGFITRGLKKRQSEFKKIAEKTENWAEDTDYRKTAPDNRKAVKEEYKTAPDSKVILVEEMRPEKDGLINECPAWRTIRHSESPGLEKIKKLKPLHQAVIWAELLGKPRSEKEIF